MYVHFIYMIALVCGLHAKPWNSDTSPSPDVIIGNCVVSLNNGVYFNNCTSQDSSKYVYDAFAAPQCTPEYGSCEVSFTCCDSMNCISGACQKCRMTGEPCGAFYDHGCCFGSCTNTWWPWGVCT
jgi:hypothetical protein